MSAVARGRAAARRRMTSLCTIRRKDGSTTVGGIKVPTWTDIHEDLPIRLAGSRGGVATTRSQDIGGAELQAAAREAHVPADTTDLADGDLIEITSGDNAGLVLRIVEASWQDQATARRMPVLAVTRPKEWA